MPTMSKLRFAAVLALAVGGAVSWASSEQDQLNALAEEDSCAADDEACTLSMRQLRGEQVAAEVEQHEVNVPTDDDDEDDDEDDEKPTSKAKTSKKKISSKSDDEDEDEEDEDEDDEDAEGDEDDDFYGDEDVNDEEEKRGPFCCQHGQGMGSANDNDEGATCYPSSKPELSDFCDNKAICQNDCNGTWLIGFCALETVDGKTADGKDPCGLELNEAETGYDYTGDGSRAVMEETCAQSAEVCGGLGCNGTWCLYVKTPIY